MREQDATRLTGVHITSPDSPLTPTLIDSDPARVVAVNKLCETRRSQLGERPRRGIADVRGIALTSGELRGAGSDVAVKYRS